MFRILFISLASIQGYNRYTWPAKTSCLLQSWPSHVTGPSEHVGEEVREVVSSRCAPVYKRHGGWKYRVGIFDILRTIIWAASSSTVSPTTPPQPRRSIKSENLIITFWIPIKQYWAPGRKLPKGRSLETRVISEDTIYSEWTDEENKL